MFLFDDFPSAKALGYFQKIRANSRDSRAITSVCESAGF